MVNGTIVPVAITCSLLLRAMNDSKCENFLIDGFPRNQDNLDGWIKEVDPELVKIQSVLFFECSHLYRNQLPSATFGFEHFIQLSYNSNQP